MPIGTIETTIQVIMELVYGRADGMPNSLQSMVVCDCYALKKFMSLNHRASRKRNKRSKKDKNIQQQVFAGGHPPNY